MRILIVACAIIVGFSGVSQPVFASGIDLSHRECTDLLSDVYKMPQTIKELYKLTYSPIERETKNPSKERAAITEKAWDLKNKHASDWADFAKSLREYCEGLE